MPVTTLPAKPLRVQGPVAPAVHPVVLRFAGLTPANLHRFVMHDRRRGGDLLHVDASSSVGNRIEHGDTAWADALKLRVSSARRSNYQEELQALRAKHRKTDAKTLEEKGPSDPWRASTEGPLREGLLTASKAFFGGSGKDQWDMGRVEKFRVRAMEFLRESFPDEQLVFASAHQDEEAYHIHFVVAVWTEKTSGNRGRQMLLQPSANPLLANYEHAQNLAGAAFEDLGLRRGERRAEARRRARAEGAPVPAGRAHVPPSQWRSEERRKGRTFADQLIADAKAAAEDVVAGARPDVEKMVRKSRKRAVKEARRRRGATDREEATTRRQLAGAEAQVARTQEILRSKMSSLAEAEAQLEQKTALLARTEALLSAMREKADEIEASANRAHQRRVEAHTQRQAEQQKATRIKTALATKIQAADARVQASMARYQALELGLKLFKSDQLQWESLRSGEPRQLLWGSRGSALRPLPLQWAKELEPAESILEIVLKLICELLEALFGGQQLAIENDAKVVQRARVELGLEPDMAVEELIARRGGSEGPGL